MTPRKVEVTWRQQQFSSTGHSNGVARPDWTDQGDCAKTDDGKWWRFRSDGHSYQYSSAVKFADVLGIDLGIDRNWGSTQRLYHNIAGNDQRLCGNNDVPATAGKIEVAWR